MGGQQTRLVVRPAALKLFLCTVLLVIFTLPAFAQADPNKANLWISDYKNLPIVFDVTANRIGVTEERLRTKVELRLRQAGIRPAGSQNPPYDRYLYINFNIVAPAFNFSVEFHRDATWVLPDGSRSLATVSTWHKGTTGTGAENSNSFGLSFVMTALDELLDEFLNAYLKANQEGIPAAADAVKPALRQASAACESECYVKCVDLGGDLGNLKQIQLHLKADMFSRFGDVVQCNETVDVIETIDQWVHVRTRDNKEGWVHSMFLGGPTGGRN